MFEWYRRWRHGRGFGVHSPFAYEMVKRVLHPDRKYSYYFEESVDGPGCRLRSRVLRLGRLAIFAGAERACVSGDGREAVENVLKLAVPGISFARNADDIKGCGLVVTRGVSMGLDEMSAYLESGVGEKGHVKALWAGKLPAGWAGSLAGALKEGIVFEDRDAILLISRPQTMKVRYTVRL